MRPGSMLVLGCPGGCGRPATLKAIICQSCMLDLPPELATEIGRTRQEMERAASAYSANVLQAAHFFDQIRPLFPAVAPRHRPDEVCDCRGDQRPFHCAATRVEGPGR